MNLLYFFRNNFLSFLFITLSTLTWSQTTRTSAATGNWSNTATWVGGVVPVAGDNVVIASGHTVTLTAAVDITTGNLTVSGTIALAGFNLTAGSLSGAGNIGSASGTPLVTVGSNGSNTTYSGIFSGTGARLTKEGTGTLTLSGANTYTGATTINVGTLQLGVASDRISNSSALTVASGATFNLGGFSETIASIAGAGTVTSSLAGTLTLSVGGDNSSTTFSGVIQNGTATSIALTKTGTGTLNLTGANTYTGATTISAGTLSIGNGGTSGAVAGNIINNASLIFYRSNNLTYAGVISGTGTLSKQGAGVLSLNKTNTMSGTTTVLSGTLSLGDGGLFGSISGSIVNNSNVIINLNGGLLLSNTITGTGSLSLEGTGQITVNGSLNYTGTTLIANGILRLSGNERISNTSALTINSGATLDLSNFSETVGSIAGTGTITSTGSGVLTLSVGVDNSSTTFSGIIQNGTATSIALTKTGTGTLTLSGANTYTGVTTISAGTLSVSTINNGGVAGNLGRATNASANIVLSGGILQYNGATASTDRGITLNNVAGNSLSVNTSTTTLTISGVITGSGSITKTGAGELTLSGTNTYTGVTTISAGTLSVSTINNGGVAGNLGRATNASANIVLNGGILQYNGATASTDRGITLNVAGNSLSVNTSTTTLTISGIITGSGTLTKTGAGTFTLSGDNTYTGATTISAGTLQLGTASERISNSSTLTVNAGATFDLNGYSESVTSLAGAGTVTSSVPGAVTFALVGNAFSTFSGIIQNGNGIVALTKAVAGTITLTGANTYTGITTISGGTVSIGDGTTAGSIASATINNNSNLTFNLPAGTYAYSGIISGAGGVTKSGTGTLTLSGTNTYAGTTSITAGTLIAGSTTALGTGSLVSVSIGATLQTDAGLNLGTLSIAGVMNCNGNNSTCQSLVLGGTVQISNGTYGSTASGATNQDNTRFTSGSTGWVLLSTSPMIITVTTTAANPTVGLPLYGTVNVRVEWGDGINNTYTTAGDRNYTYATPGNYTIRIYGVLTVFGSGINYTNRNQITGVTSWGSTGLVSLQQAFELSTNLTQLPTTLPSTVSNLSYTFRSTSFNQNISSWNTANVKNMAGMFQDNTAFNQPIGSWNTGNVTIMTDMFRDATAFNQNIGGWNTSNVTTTQGMFFGATAFNQDISAWNIRNVTTMINMFFSAGLSYCNYDALLLSWATQTPRRSSVQFHGGNSKYTSAATAARATLTGAGSSWTISDGGLITPVGVASSTQTRCINTALTPITHTTNGFSGIGTPTGLPTGVTANWSSNTITISGTPTSSGTFNYSIPLTGGCTSANATGIITVNPLNTVGVASSTPSVCFNSTLIPITHSTTVATGIGTPSGLPNGVSANWAGNTITISGAPTSSGTFNYTIPLTGGCGSVSASGTITVSNFTVFSSLSNNDYVWLGSSNSNWSTTSNWVIYNSATASYAPASNFPNNSAVNVVLPTLGGCVLNNALTGGNTVSVNNLTIESGHTFQLDNASGVLNIAGTLVNNGTWSTPITGSTVVFNGAGSQTIPVLSYSNLQTAVGGTKTLGGSLSIPGTLTVGASSTLDLSNNTLTLTSTGTPLVINGTLNSNTGTVNYAASGTQNIAAASYYKLKISGSSNKSLLGTTTVTNELILEDGTLVLAANTLNVNTSIITKSNGTIDASDAGATLVFGNSSTLTLPNGVFSAAVNNLTLSGSKVKASNDFTVNGTLNLNNTNPSDIDGLLDLVQSYGSYGDVHSNNSTDENNNLSSVILTLGSNVTVIGQGDITGKVRRTSFTSGTSYAFNNANMQLAFTGASLPTQITVVQTKGNEGLHVDKNGTHDTGPNGLIGGAAVKRMWQILKTGGASPTTFSVRFPYLDSELNSNTEANLVTWDHHLPYGGMTPHEHGKTNINTTLNYVELSNHGIGYLATEGDAGFTKYWMLSQKVSPDTLWLGAAGDGSLGSWTAGINWSSGAVPSSLSKIIIDPTVYNNELTLTSTQNVGAIEIKPNGVVNGGSNTTLTLNGGPAVNGGAGTWINQGTFNAGTSTVVFNYDAATLLGTTNFYNVIVNTGKKLTPQSGAKMGVSGALTLNGVLDASTNSNEIIFNGSNQTIPQPNGTVPGYSGLSIEQTSGGIATLGENIKVLDNLNMTVGNISTNGNILEIGNGISRTGNVNWTDGSVLGQMKRWFGTSPNSTQASGIFPVGTSDFNRNAIINFTTSTTGGYIITEFVPGKPLVFDQNNALKPDPFNLPLPFVNPTNGGNSYIENADTTGHWEITPYSSSNVAYGALDNKKYDLTLRINSNVISENPITANPPGMRIIRAKGNPSGSHNPFEIASPIASITPVVGNPTGTDFLIKSDTIQGFSWFTIGGDDTTPLPVELMNFNAELKDRVVNLTWQTASEQNNDFFTVERSADGYNFEPILYKDGAGNSTSLMSYSDKDLQPLEGVSYYRLKQTDFDGAYEYSDIRVVSSAADAQVLIYPNPSRGSVLISANAPITNIKLIASDGRILEEHPSLNELKLELTSGIYHLQYVFNEKTYSKKIVIVH